MPRGTVQSVKFHAVAEEGQLGQGGASSGPPGRSRPFSKLARAPDGCGGAGFESQSPFDWVSGSPAGLLLSWSVIHGLFWAYFTCAGIAGQSTTAMLYYEPPYSPSHAPLFLAEARGSGWGVGLPSLVGASSSVGHTRGSGFPLGLCCWCHRCCWYHGCHWCWGCCRCHDAHGCLGCGECRGAMTVAGASDAIDASVGE